MAQAPFIPSAAPHSVEMPQGSAIAKSRSGSTGTDIRRAEQDHLAPDQAIQLEPHHIVLQGGAVATGPVPRVDDFVSASDAQALAGVQQANKVAALGGSKTPKRPINGTAAADMDFPARFIKLKIANEAVRAQLQSLQSLMRDDG
jgi:hypothetical protein